MPIPVLAGVIGGCIVIAGALFAHRANRLPCTRRSSSYGVAAAYGRVGKGVGLAEEEDDVRNNPNYQDEHDDDGDDDALVTIQ
jgi:hypothetical protein